MQLPLELKKQLDDLSLNISLSEWKHACQQLSDLYRNPHRAAEIGRLPSDRMRLAYLHVRLPATYAAIVHVLNECCRCLPHLRIESVADVGSGPGTGLFASAEVFDGLKKVTCYERDAGFIALSRQLSQGWNRVLKQWMHTDVTRQWTLEEHDLVLASYALGEMDEKARLMCVQKLWKHSTGALVVIEPGTPQGFEVIRKVRTELIAQGADIVAPCPHQGECPMGSGNWCHFSARVERSSLHRQMKMGMLNYEDEKFSYLIAAREPGIAVLGRIVRHPQKKSGFVSVDVCGVSGIDQKIITRQSKEEYRLMRKAQWGDHFNFES